MLSRSIHPHISRRCIQHHRSLHTNVTRNSAKVVGNAFSRDKRVNKLVFFPPTCSSSLGVVRHDQFSAHSRSYASMFSSLTSKITDTFDTIRNKKKITKADVDFAIQRIKQALLGADVAEPIVKDILKKLQDAVTGTRVRATDEVPKAAFIFAQLKDSIIQLLGGDQAKLNVDVPDEKKPAVFLLVGTQGSGKTTTCAKIGFRLMKIDKKKVLVASLDVRRPAAQEQLEILSKNAGVDCLERSSYSTLLKQSSDQEFPNPLDIAKKAMERANEINADVLILDSAGRLHIDKELMKEIEEISQLVKPVETLLVADAMLGYDAVRIARQFHEKVGLTGICLTRMDADAKGGAALSMRSVTGVPIKLIGTGEKVQDTDLFDPKRMASRILGGGDMDGLAEKARLMMDEVGEQKLKESFLKAAKTKTFTFDDYLIQLKSMSKLGSMKNLVQSMPQSILDRMGLNEKMMKLMDGMNMEEIFELHQMIISHMQEDERKEPFILESSFARRQRLAKDANVPVAEINKLLKYLKKYSSGIDNPMTQMLARKQ